MLRLILLFDEFLEFARYFFLLNFLGLSYFLCLSLLLCLSCHCECQSTTRYSFVKQMLFLNFDSDLHGESRHMMTNNRGKAPCLQSAMNTQYYNDPIENFDSDESMKYYDDVYWFQDNQISEGVNDAYIDDLDLEYSEYMRLVDRVYCLVIRVRSSPSPMRDFESRNMHQSRHTQSYYQPDLNTRTQNSFGDRQAFQGTQDNWRENFLSKLML